MTFCIMHVVGDTVDVEHSIVSREKNKNKFFFSAFFYKLVFSLWMAGIINISFTKFKLYVLKGLIS